MLIEIWVGALGENGMKCLNCDVEIRRNDAILLVAEATYNGPRNDDITYQLGLNRIDGVIHLECLQSSGDAARTSNTDVVEVSVERSDALSLLVEEGGCR